MKLKTHKGKIFLALILLLTAFLTLYNIWTEGYGNEYYTAAVKSMLKSWHNFFFVSFDTGGFITVDKPPLGLWLQCLFGLVFGVHGWSVILPEALCTIASVAVLYSMVKKRQGELCGLLAALFMALTPIVAAVSRTNNLDATLVFVCLLAMWALLAAAERGSLRFLLLSLALLGLGFNIKMLQAYMFLPAVFLVYFFTAETSLPKRIGHLALATGVLLVVSLSWSLIVDVTPATQRPFVGSSTSNSELELAIGYNGILRALPLQSEALKNISGAISSVPNEGAAAGVLRLFNREMAGQIAWLLPLALFGLAALVLGLLRKASDQVERLARRGLLRQLLLWGGLFVPMVVYFSVSGHIHRYYLIMLAPSLAVLAALAVAEFVRCPKGILLPVSLFVTAGAQVYILKAHYAKYAGVLVPLIIAAVGAGIVLLVLAKLLKTDKPWLRGIALALGLLGLLAAPAYWAYSPIQFGTNVITPFAGPPKVSQPTDNGEIQGSSMSWEKKWFEGADLNGELVSDEAMAYILQHNNGAQYDIAMPNVMFSAPVMLKYDVSIMTLGGFVGTDKTLTLDDFKQLVAEGKIHYYYAMMGARSEIDNWVSAVGKKVTVPSTDSTATGGDSSMPGGAPPSGAQPEGAPPAGGGQSPTGGSMPKMSFFTIYDLSALKKK